MAGDFTVDFVEWDVSPIAVLLLHGGSGFGGFGFGRGLCPDVFLVSLGLFVALGGFRCGIRVDASVVVLGSEGFTHFRRLLCVILVTEK